MKSFLHNCFCLAGIALLSFGLYIFHPAVAWIILGILLIGVGVTLHRKTGKEKPK